MEEIENKNITNGWAYAAIGCMIMHALSVLSVLSEHIVSMDYSWLMAVFTVVDALLLRQEKIANAPSPYWVWFAPVYYYKRQKALNQSMLPFYIISGAFIATFVFIIVVAILMVLVSVE